MVWFVIAIILALAGLACLGISFLGQGGDAPKSRYDDSFTITPGPWRLAMAGCLVVAFLLFLISGAREVPTRAVGVPTAFGRVEAPMTPGIHLFNAPWTNVNILDETIQTTTFEGTKLPDGATGPNQNTCLDVRIGGQQTACLDVTIQWRILDSGASGLFNDYNGQGSSIMNTITDAVVIRELKQVVNQVLGDYNPIQDVSVNATAGNSQFSTFGPKVLSQMRRDLAGRITVANLLMPLLRYDQATQNRLNQIQQQFGQTAIAQEQVATNQAQAKANSAIAGSLNTSSGVLQYQCLQIAEQAIKNGDANVQPGYCFGLGSVITSNGK